MSPVYIYLVLQYEAANQFNDSLNEVYMSILNAVQNNVDWENVDQQTFSYALNTLNKIYSTLNDTSNQLMLSIYNNIANAITGQSHSIEVSSSQL